MNTMLLKCKQEVHAAKLTIAEGRQYVHLNRMDSHVVTLSVVVSSHFDAGDHPLEAVQQSFLLHKVVSRHG